MYVVWRKKPVKGTNGGRFLDGDFWNLDEDHAILDGKPWRSYVWAKNFPNPRCEHKATGRIAYTPIIVQSVRASSKEGFIYESPRQELLHRFPTIRSCCIADPFNRAAWWHKVERDIRGWTDFRGDTALHRRWLLDRKSILDKLREVVPKPNYYVLKDIRYRQDAVITLKVAEFTARMKADDEAYKKQREEHQRQERARHERDFEDFFAFYQDKGPLLADAYAVFGFSVGANFDEVKAAYRKLAKQHHPDMDGGDDAKFRHVQEAWEKIEKHYQKRAAS